jgi:transposase
MSGDRASPRYDVVATTRRSWSREQKKAIVAEIDVDGATLSEVARRHGIHSSLLFRWRKTFASVMGETPVVVSAMTSAVRSPKFVPVMLSPPSPPSASGPLAKASTIEIALDGRRTVRVGADVDTGALVRIIEALETSR